ncbi:hypothetical protein HNP32_001478 [Brevundimonas bullata]|uniref:Tat pathway signal protein n=1 Tax=Brevundimonas bullata TaxID=13160 RepID=A0A7W7INS2_9CAUL|nr:hypothetical protein [Brevundimonas bullata]MBB4797754.1 hypothetical protein [Brevundimonas bullata]MBB6382713.1 hypothetical protein [Brevundimonas bullata]
MKRRALIQAGALLTVSAVASGARASEKAEPAAAPFLNLPGMGLPVITDGRVRNYVFIVLKLHLGPAYAVEAVRAKEAHLRDALVRAGHRTPFVLPNTWVALDTAALSASLIRSASTLIGRGAVTRVEVVSQTPRRRTGMQGV